MRVEVILTFDKISPILDLTDYIDVDNGAVSSFLGVVRREFKEKWVGSLFYESYQEMAKKEIQAIVKEVRNKCEIDYFLFKHRLGKVIAGEISVLLVARAPRRKDSFKALIYVASSFKKRVPIWKQEIYEDGTKAWI
ncbi:MAG: molybdenum cofactor biosynthesis protein MoaE [SAR324 cluster bacterium]|nr:molybdenum cofactor biosynthesis protein MoaE [SAR324 cluster bacterium]